MEEQNHIWNLITKKLSGETTIKEQQELEAFLKAHPEQQYTVDMLADWWNHRATDKTHEDNNLNFKQLQAQLALSEGPGARATDPEPSRSLRWQKAAVLVAVVLFLGWAAYFYIQRNRSAAPAQDQSGILSQVSTSYGSKSQVVLPDGTRVWLNAGSNLTYNNTNFGTRNRRVTLSGEAYFQVEHNEQAPFIVHAGKIMLKVLGTAFDIKSYPEDPMTQATLIQGAIAISLDGDSNAPILLKPSQTLTIFKQPPSQPHQITHAHRPTGPPHYQITPLIRLPGDSIIVETSWVDDKLAFRNECFAVLERKMERWYNVHMTFTDPEIKKYTFSGVFVNESLEQALQTLRIDSPFDYRIEGDEVYLSKATAK